MKHDFDIYMKQRGSGKTFKKLSQALGLILTGHNVMWISVFRRRDCDEFVKITRMAGIDHRFRFRLGSEAVYESSKSYLKLFDAHNPEWIESYPKGRMGLICMIDHAVTLKPETIEKLKDMRVIIL